MDIDIIARTFLLFYFLNLIIETAFENCHKQDPEFDVCMKDALNSIRPYFKTGII